MFDFWDLRCKSIRGLTLEYWGGGLESFGNKYLCGKMGELNKGPQGMVEINMLSTKEVEIHII